MRKTLVAVLILSMFVGPTVVYSQPVSPKGQAKGWIEKLGLDQKQKQELRSLKQKYHQNVRRYRQQLREKRRELRRLLSSGDIDKARVEAIIDEIVDIQKKLLMERVEHIVMLRKVLTPEQCQKIQEMRQRRAKQRRMRQS